MKKSAYLKNVVQTIICFLLVGFEPGQGNPAQPVIMQQDWKTLVASHKKQRHQRVNHQIGWRLAPATTGARSSGAGLPRG